MRTCCVAVCVCLLVCLCVLARVFVRWFSIEGAEPHENFAFSFSFLTRKLFANFAVFEVDMLPLDATLNKSSSSHSSSRSSTSWCLIMMMMGSGSGRKEQMRLKNGEQPSPPVGNKSSEWEPAVLLARLLGCSTKKDMHFLPGNYLMMGYKQAVDLEPSSIQAVL